MAGKLISNGSASSLTVASPSAKRAKIARRVDFGVFLDGHSAIHEFFDGFVKNSKDFRLLESEVQSAKFQLGIGQFKLSWVNKSTKEDYACDFIILVTLD